MRQRILGLDVGTKTIGMALGLKSMDIAQPLSTLRRQSVKKDVPKIIQVCQQQRIDHIVVGLPLQLDGTEGRSARLARQIGEELSVQGALTIEYFDERYTTVEASRRLQESGVHAHNQKKMIDQVAAMVILEDWMSNQS